MRERVVRFGPGNSLMGILTEPDSESAVPNAPIAVIPNAGVVHRVGPFRLHVWLARRLAAAGFATLRLDLSGLGDSAVRPGKVAGDDRALMDISDAMDYLSQSRNANSFVLAGLCSGAFNAHRASVRDERVLGAVFIDGIAFRTLGFYVRHHLLRYFKPRYIRNMIKRRLKGLMPLENDPGNKLAEQEFFGEGLAKDQTQRELSDLLDRGVRMLFLYTDGCDDVSHRLQFKEMYGFTPDEEQLQVEYHSRAEHTLRLLENRTVIVGRIVDWYKQQFGQPSDRSLQATDQEEGVPSVAGC
ncbi:MAG: alpha/beta hydrolase family protein [Planctomycetota bacterium]